MYMYIYIYIYSKLSNIRDISSKTRPGNWRIPEIGGIFSKTPRNAPKRPKTPPKQLCIQPSHPNTIPNIPKDCIYAHNTPNNEGKIRCVGLG